VPAAGSGGRRRPGAAVPVFGETGRLALPGIVVHGGAGVFRGLDEQGRSDRYEEGLKGALGAGWEVLVAGGRVLEAVVEAVAAFEDSGHFNAGRGAVPTVDGTVEFDAGVMDGSSGRVGAVCAATWPANPVRVARAIAEVGGAPDGPLLLAAAGADRFAEEHGFPPMDPLLLTALRTGAPPGGGGSTPPDAVGTVGAVAVDAGGHVAAATSTGGRAGQLRGRVGDSAIPGAGVWAAADTVAISATGAGEAFMVAGFGRMIDLALRHEAFRGEGVLDEATMDEETLEEARLAGAIQAALWEVAALGGEGGGIAVTPAGAYAANFTSAAMARGWRDATGVSTRIGR
jgi:beta-aspartyl-peptidase (threonine type)